MNRPIASTAVSHLCVPDLNWACGRPIRCQSLVDFVADVIKIEAGDGVDPMRTCRGQRPRLLAGMEPIVSPAPAIEPRYS